MQRPEQIDRRRRETRQDGKRQDTVTAGGNAENPYGTAHLKFQTEHEKQSFLKGLFLKFDLDGKGQISLDELQFILETIGISLSHAAVSNLFDDMDTDNSGFIDLDEFYNVFAAIDRLNDLRTDMQTSQFRSRVKSVIVGALTMLNLFFMFILLYLYIQERVEPYQTLLIIDSVLSGVLLFIMVVYPLVVGKCYQYQIPEKFEHRLERMREWMVGDKHRPELSYVVKPAQGDRRESLQEFSYRKKLQFACDDSKSDITEVEAEETGSMKFQSALRDDFEDENVADLSCTYEKNAYAEAEEAQLARDEYTSFQPMCTGRVSTVSCGASLAQGNHSGTQWMQQSFMSSFSDQLMQALADSTRDADRKSALAIEN